MTTAADLEALSHTIASAIATRDVSTLRGLLAPGFAARSPGAPPTDAEAFLAGIAQIPGEMVFVRVEDLQVDVEADSAIVTGVQHAQVRVNGDTVDDRRVFVDYFIRSGDAWLLRVAVDLGT